MWKCKIWNSMSQTEKSPEQSQRKRQKHGQRGKSKKQSQTKKDEKRAAGDFLKFEFYRHTHKGAAAFGRRPLVCLCVSNLMKKVNSASFVFFWVWLCFSTSPFVYLLSFPLTLFLDFSFWWLFMFVLFLLLLLLLVLVCFVFLFVVLLCSCALLSCFVFCADFQVSDSCKMESACKCSFWCSISSKASHFWCFWSQGMC